MKYFKVKMSVIVELPYEESLLDGLVNKNHLMYLAVAELYKGNKCFVPNFIKGNPLIEITEHESRIG